MTLTKEWLLKTIAELEEERDATPGAVNEDAAKALAAMKLALASLEADKEHKHHSVIAEQLAHVLSSMDATDHQRAVISCAVDRLNNVSQLLQSSPSALLVPETLDYQGAKELYNYLMNEEETNATVNGWNACRAAMLQGADQAPVKHPSSNSVLGWLRADYQDDNRGLRGNAPLFVLGKKDPSTVWGLDYIPLTSNSPVIPDGWVACSERMPPPKTGVIVGCWFGRNWATKWATYLPYHPDAHQSGFLMPGGSWTPTHWMPLPAAPQQEVK